MKIDFMVFSERGKKLGLPAAFYLIKNIDLSQSYRWSKVSACVYFYCTHDFNMKFAAIILKLSGYFLGIRIKKMIEPNFALGL